LQRFKILLQSKIFLCFTFSFLVGYLFLFTKVIHYSSCYTDNTHDFIGDIISYEFDGDKFSYILQAEEKIQASYYFQTLEEKNIFQKQIQLGQKIRVQGTLIHPNQNTIPNTFNYKEYLYYKGIYWTLSVEKIEILDSDISLFYQVKNAFIDKANSYTKISPYMHAFILGDCGYLDSDVYANLRNNGVTHLFAISGMHIGFLTFLLEFFLKKIHLKERTIYSVIFLFLIFYLFLVGFTPSVIRASLFYFLLFLNKRFRWNLKNIILLYYLFFFLLLLHPFYLYDMGFVYSFLTSFGLMLFSKKIAGNYFSKLFKTSAIAFIFSLPVTLYHFYEFNLLTIFNNLIIVPFVSLILFPLTLITFVLPFLEGFLNFGFIILEFINEGLNSIGITIVVSKISWVFMFCYYSIIYLCYRYKMCYLVFLPFFLFVHSLFPYLDSNAYVYYLDVGQGDATLIITENKKDVILIDSGGKIEYTKEEWQIRHSSYSLADNISTFLKSLGITKIDLFIGTHGDIDHIGYAEEIFKKIKVQQIMLNHNAYNYEEQKLLKLTNYLNGNDYSGKNIYLQNLNSFIEKDENDSSLVLYTKIGEKYFLFMGDAPKKVEKDLLQKYHFQIDVLKVGHHGSNTSSDFTFLKAIDPKYAIISAGRNNRYHHPSSDTIQNLKEANIIYYNTQDRGTICYVLNKESEKIKFYPP